ncbi:hypothetical protein GTQ40_03690 [Flavobacteriaceae bacterium R38]|nr:hypothetical protein [Flavobacteriaceae bacterium R38]
MEKPKKVISVEEARSLQDFWCKTRGKAIEEECGYVDCREFSYSIKELEEYIAFVKHEAKEKGYKKKSLGLRIYLGTYPPEGDKHDGLSTVFITPTGKKKNRPGGSGKEGVTDDRDDNIYEIDPLNRGGVGDPPINY